LAISARMTSKDSQPDPSEPSTKDGQDQYSCSEANAAQAPPTKVAMSASSASRRLRDRIATSHSMSQLGQQHHWPRADNLVRSTFDTVAKLVDVEICALIVRPQQESDFV
jgi:hypothetical protein